jgi:predicted lysophospholipase L1 biosynthesis ABC-type transport system permease subunit
VEPPDRSTLWILFAILGGILAVAAVVSAICFERWTQETIHLHDSYFVFNPTGLLILLAVGCLALAGGFFVRRNS